MDPITIEETRRRHAQDVPAGPRWARSWTRTSGAAADLVSTLNGITDEEFERIRDTKTQDDDLPLDSRRS
jgi:hypothetical protein